MTVGPINLSARNPKPYVVVVIVVVVVAVVVVVVVDVVIVVVVVGVGAGLLLLLLMYSCCCCCCCSCCCSCCCWCCGGCSCSCCSCSPSFLPSSFLVSLLSCFLPVFLSLQKKKGLKVFLGKPKKWHGTHPNVRKHAVFLGKTKKTYQKKITKKHRPPQRITAIKSKLKSSSNSTGKTYPQVGGDLRFRQRLSKATNLLKNQMLSCHLSKPLRRKLALNPFSTYPLNL